jgi:hypothetical protein
MLHSERTDRAPADNRASSSTNQNLIELLFAAHELRNAVRGKMESYCASCDNPISMREIMLSVGDEMLAGVFCDDPRLSPSVKRLMRALQALDAPLETPSLCTQSQPEEELQRSEEGVNFACVPCSVFRPANSGNQVCLACGCDFRAHVDAQKESCRT